LNLLFRVWVCSTNPCRHALFQGLGHFAIISPDPLTYICPRHSPIFLRHHQCTSKHRSKQTLCRLRVLRGKRRGMLDRVWAVGTVTVMELRWPPNPPTAYYYQHLTTRPVTRRPSSLRGTILHTRSRDRSSPTRTSTCCTNTAWRVCH
jgi:hypothetical protein